MTADEVIKTLREWPTVTSSMRDMLDGIADAVEALKTEYAELRRLDEKTGLDVTHWRTVAEGVMDNNAYLHEQLAELREQQVRYVEVPLDYDLLDDDATYLGVCDDDTECTADGCDIKEGWEEPGEWSPALVSLYRIDNLPPRTPENTVPLKKETSVMKRAAKVIWETAPVYGFGEDTQETAKRVANALNAAGLLREEPK